MFTRGLVWRKLFLFILMMFVLFLVSCPGPEPFTDTENSVVNQDTEQEDQATIDIYNIPCSAGTGFNQQFSNLSYASQYAQNVMAQACYIGGVSLPSGGMYASQGINNAFYFPQEQAVVYDPDWLYQFVVNTGFLESGDSILFHEIGHHWSFLTGRQAGLSNTASSQVDYNWKSEYTADSFAGYILRGLNGNAQPSVSIYMIIMANWSQSHPPGERRAQVFYNSWYYQTVYDYSNATSVARSSKNDSDEIDYSYFTNDTNEEIEVNALSELTVLSRISETLISDGENPFSPDSDEAFNELIYLTR